MRLPVLSSAALVLFTLSATLAAAQSPPALSCSRLTSLERAKCLVQQHKQIMDALTHASSSTVVTAVGPAPISCSRATGIARAQCLAQQHKQMLEQLARHPVVSSPLVATVVVRRQSCNRFTDRNERLKCLNAQNAGGSSSSAK